MDNHTSGIFLSSAPPFCFVPRISPVPRLRNCFQFSAPSADPSANTRQMPIRPVSPVFAGAGAAHQRRAFLRLPHSVRGPVLCHLSILRSLPVSSTTSHIPAILEGSRSSSNFLARSSRDKFAVIIIPFISFIHRPSTMS